MQMIIDLLCELHKLNSLLRAFSCLSLSLSLVPLLGLSAYNAKCVKYDERSLITTKGRTDDHLCI